MGIIVVWLRKILIAGFQCRMNYRYFLIFVTYLPFRANPGKKRRKKL